MVDAAAVKKQLKIRSSVVQRLAKETKLYVKETADLVAKKDKFVADGADEWDIKNATKMVTESEKMEVETQTRLTKAVEDLQQLIKSAKEEAGLGKDDDLLNAEEAVKGATS